MSNSDNGLLRQCALLTAGLVAGTVIGMACRSLPHPRASTEKASESLASSAFASMLKGQYANAASRVGAAKELAADPRGEEWMSILFVRPSAIGEIYDLEDTPSAGAVDALDAGIIATLLSGVSNDSASSTFYCITYLLDIDHEAVVAESERALSATDRSRHLGQLRDLARDALIGKYTMNYGYDGSKWRRHILKISP